MFRGLCRGQDMRGLPTEILSRRALHAKAPRLAARPPDVRAARLRLTLRRPQASPQQGQLSQKSADAWHRQHAAGRRGRWWDRDQRGLRSLFSRQAEPTHWAHHRPAPPHRSQQGLAAMRIRCTDRRVRERRQCQPMLGRQVLPARSSEIADWLLLIELSRFPLCWSNQLGGFRALPPLALMVRK